MKSIKLTGDALHTAVAIQDTKQGMLLALDDIKNECLVRMKNTRDHFHSQKQEQWTRLCEILGLDPSGEYSIDMEYMEEHGFAMLRIKEPGDRDNSAPGDVIAEIMDAITRH